MAALLMAGPLHALSAVSAGSGRAAPRLEGLSALARERCTYGLKVELGENYCTVQIGQR